MTVKKVWICAFTEEHGGYAHYMKRYDDQYIHYDFPTVKFTLIYLDFVFYPLNRHRKK